MQLARLGYCTYSMHVNYTSVGNRITHMQPCTSWLLYIQYACKLYKCIGNSITHMQPCTSWLLYIQYACKLYKCRQQHNPYEAMHVLVIVLIRIAAGLLKNDVLMIINWTVRSSITVHKSNIFIIIYDAYTPACGCSHLFSWFIIQTCCCTRYNAWEQHSVLTEQRQSNS